MKPTNKPFALKMVFSVSFLFLILASSVLASNIQGFVYDKQRNPLPDVDVELLNDYYQTVQRTRTSGNGRYNFDRLTDGRYTVRVLAFRYDLEDQEMMVEIATQGITSSQSGSQVTTGSGTFVQDFYLSPKKGGLRDSELGVVFAQDVPKEAKTAYEKAVEDFSKKRDEEAFTSLKKSIELFPTYYLALHRYGLELYSRKQYMESAQVLLEAIKVNPKNATDFFYVGQSFFNLGEKYRKAAFSATNQAVILAPSSPQAHLLLGKIERANSKFPEAEKHLLQAKKLSTTKNPDIHWELALLYGNNLKKYKEAADELELYLKSGNFEDADVKKTKKLIADFRAKSTQASK